MSLTVTDRNLDLLHPNMRQRVVAVLNELQSEQLPLRIFEAYRTPERQAYLYAQGRTRPGKIVTYARAWESYHQYGLAVDIVGHGSQGWTWDLSKDIWNRMHAIGANHGLERLGFETPHLQLAELRIADLMDGNLPKGGDAPWRDNLTKLVARWDGQPHAPKLPWQIEEASRPGIREFAEISSSVKWSDTPKPASGDWHAFHGGREWKFDAGGVYLRSNPNKPQRTPGAPTTCQSILDLLGPAIHAASIRYNIPPEVIVMTIATEAGFARKNGFTGPRTFRWEPHVSVKDVTPHTFGDYSAGPMQPLATTARYVIRRDKLNYADPLVVAPYLKEKPSQPPTEHSLYAYEPNLDIGTAEIRHRLPKTGSDPILVSAAYNAGGLYKSDLNEWHLRSMNDHLDRAAAWYGDACFVLDDLRRF